MDIFTKLLTDKDFSIDEIENKTAEFRYKRVMNKSAENRNKKPLISPDVVNAADFTFEPFIQQREDGDSGSLFLATHKNVPSQKYIVKHAYCDCAANEYVYSKMARVMGLKVPDVKLFKLTDPLDDTLFKTEYVAGIEYLNIADANPNLEALANSKNPDDYFKFLSLQKIFCETDILQVVLADDGYIYRIDTSDAFALNDMTLFTMGVYTSEDTSGTCNRGQSGINEKSFSRLWNILEVNNTIQFYVNEYGEDKFELLMEPLLAVQKVYKLYLDSFLDTLCYFYPELLFDYYTGFFIALKKAMKRTAGMIMKYR